MKRKPNPIIVAAKRGLKQEPVFQAWLGKWDELPPETQFDIVRRFFTDEAIYEIGWLVLGALVAGDKQMALAIRDAIKQSNHTFNRDRELALLKPAMRYRIFHWDEILFKNGGRTQRAVEELKAGIERECNNGETLDQYRWSRLRRALGLPKRSCIRGDGKPVKRPKSVARRSTPSEKFSIQIASVITVHNRLGQRTMLRSLLIGRHSSELRQKKYTFKATVETASVTVTGKCSRKGTAAPKKGTTKLP